VDFIERMFNISPDHGTGLTELAILVALCAVPLLFAALRNRSKRPVCSVKRTTQANIPR
jgi:hypothetical protein